MRAFIIALLFSLASFYSLLPHILSSLLMTNSVSIAKAIANSSISATPNRFWNVSDEGEEMKAVR